MKKLQIIALSRMEEMRKYLYDYLTELSQFDPDIKFDQNSVPIYQWFDCYWEEKDRYPIYFIIDNVVAGFCLLRELNDKVYDIAEFYVLPEFRKDGNAIEFAKKITELFEGQFCFSTRFTNRRAIKFWQKFANLFSDNYFFDDEILRNWIIRKSSAKTNQLNLNPIYFKLIKKGQKIYEGRLNDPQRQTFKVGDNLIFFKEPNKKQTIKAVITQKLIFESFEQVAESLDKDKLGFALKTKQQMIDTYHSFYSQENIKKYGLVIFKIKVVKHS